MNDKQRVLRTLEFDHPDRAPRQLWVLPWAQKHHPEQLAAIQRDFPSEFASPPAYLRRHARTVGDAYARGEYIDEWGCRFENRLEGVIGEVKHALVAPEDENWDDVSAIHTPVEWLTADTDSVNAWCKAHSDKFLMAPCCPRPFEQLQFIRGTQQLYIDLMLKPAGMMRFIARMHAFYCELLELWAHTDIDALNMMDDWGSQISLLIPPRVWLDIFAPMYRDYIAIAHSHGKKMFMHSDGHTLDIYPHLVEMGLDAFNSQLFCMGVPQLARYRGKITFWGEIDRQWLLPRGSVSDIENAVRDVHAALWQDGGCIAQCEFGVNARPENVRAVYGTWDALTAAR